MSITPDGPRGGTALVRVDGDAEIMWLTLDRPERLNAFTLALHADLADTLTRIEQAPPRVLVLTGAGRGFCSGQDMAERRAQIEAGETVDLAASLDRRYNAVIRRLAALPSIIVAAVNGVAAGAGLGLVLAADIVVAARSARFVLGFGAIGLGPDAGVSWRLPRLIGEQRALALILTGEPVGAEQARDWGMVWKVVDDDALRPAVDALAATLAAGSPDAQRAARRLVRDPAPSLDEQLDRERDAQGVLGGTAFYRERALLAGKRG